MFQGICVVLMSGCRGYGMFRRVNGDLGTRIDAATEANVVPSARL